MWTVDNRKWKCQHISLKSRQMKTVSKELILELKVSTHDFKVLTHEDNRQSGNKMSTHRIKESTHENSEQIFKYDNEGVNA